MSDCLPPKFNKNRAYNIPDSAVTVYTISASAVGLPLKLHTRQQFSKFDLILFTIILVCRKHSGTVKPLTRADFSAFVTAHGVSEQKL